LPLQNNLDQDFVGYAFEIASRVIGNGVDRISTTAVVWSDEPITVTADEASAVASKKIGPEAINFLRELLSKGPMRRRAVLQLGREAGVTEKAPRIARIELGATVETNQSGECIWVPSDGASRLRLVVDNEEEENVDLSDQPDGDESA
jgi:hypothetical protein